MGPLTLVLSNLFKVYYKLWFPVKAASLDKDFGVSTVCLLDNFSTLLGLKRILKQNDKGLSYLYSRFQLRASWLAPQTRVTLAKMRRVLLSFLPGFAGKARICRNECRGRSTFTRIRCTVLQGWKPEKGVSRWERGYSYTCGSASALTSLGLTPE